METTSIRFADAARHLGEVARSRGLVVPAFRSPPRCGDVSRSIRRRADGGATVSVALRGRPWPAVLADLIEGVVATNRLDGAAAGVARDGLWEAATRALLLPGADVSDVRGPAVAASPAAPAAVVGVVSADRPRSAGDRSGLVAA